MIQFNKIFSMRFLIIINMNNTYTVCPREPANTVIMCLSLHQHVGRIGLAIQLIDIVQSQRDDSSLVVSVHQLKFTRVSWGMFSYEELLISKKKHNHIFYFRPAGWLVCMVRICDCAVASRRWVNQNLSYFRNFTFFIFVPKHRTKQNINVVVFSDRYTNCGRDDGESNACKIYVSLARPASDGKSKLCDYLTCVIVRVSGRIFFHETTTVSTAYYYNQRHKWIKVRMGKINFLLQYTFGTFLNVTFTIKKYVLWIWNRMNRKV